MEKLDKFYNRLKNIGIDITIAANYPWMYLNTVNGKKVTEKFKSEHGFVVGYAPIRMGAEFKFEDTSELFKVLRKYGLD